MKTERPVSEIFVAMTERGWKVHEAPDKILVKKFPDHRGGGNSWEVAINGNAEKRVVFPGAWDIDLPPFTAAVLWNGWLAGLVGPYDGVLMKNNRGANEDALIASLRALPAA